MRDLESRGFAWKITFIGKNKGDVKTRKDGSKDGEEMIENMSKSDREGTGPRSVV